MNYKLFFTIFFLIIFKFTESFSSINNKIIAKVGNDIITSYELENKIRTILFLSKKEINQNNINQVKQKAINDLINKKLQKNEINKYKIITNKERVNSYIEKFSSSLKITKSELKQKMIQNSIDFDLYYNDVEIDLSWQTLIYELNKERIVLDDSQIISELNEIISNRKNLNEYELAEIAIDSIDGVENEKIIIKEINEYINNFGFEEAALKYSTSSSANNGGRIGWIKADSLSEKLEKSISKMNIGQVSKPIKSTNKILFIKLTNKRKAKTNLDLEAEKIKNSLVNKRKNELLNLYSNNHLSKKRNNTQIKFFNE